MSKKKAAEFITKLSTDHALREKFKKDPDGTMAAAGLDDVTKAVLKRGNPDEVRKHLGDDAPPGCFLLF